MEDTLLHTWAVGVDRPLQEAPLGRASEAGCLSIQRAGVTRPAPCQLARQRSKGMAGRAVQ